MSDARMGVFVCHCGTNIGGVVDVPEVTQYAKGLPDVVYAEHNLYTCSEEGISSIKKRIPEYRLNRVIVASCTPRTHEPLFRSACQEAGLNRYLFEFVNIREQCSWAHIDLPEEATEKAKTLIRMGVEKARLLEPLEEIEVKVAPSCLLIGGGIAGMSAALNLANQGFQVHLVEKEAELGGLLLSVHKLFPTNREAKELLSPIINKVRNHHKIEVYTQAKVKEISGFIGNFNVTLEQGGEDIKFNVGTIIVATGAEEFKPHGQYGYGKMQGVSTQLELEEQMKRGRVEGRNFVIVNCVGARVPERPYCSRFGCMTAVKNAMMLKENNPEAKVWVLHRDLMAYGVDFEDYYRKAMEKGVRFIRYSLERPPEVMGNGKVNLVKVYHELRGREIELPCDELILTTPLVPRKDNAQISRILKVPLDENGFFLEAHLKLQPVEFPVDGIFICGSAKWPVEIPEAISQGYASASKAAAPMRRGYVRPEATTAWVDEDICMGCGLCVEACPYGATELKRISRFGRLVEVSSVNDVLCKGCGACAAGCPSGAMQHKNTTKRQVFEMISAAVA